MYTCTCFRKRVSYVSVNTSPQGDGLLESQDQLQVTEIKIYKKLTSASMEHDASEIESEIQSMFSQTIANASGYDGLTFHLMHCGAAAEHISPNQATAFEAS